MFGGNFRDTTTNQTYADNRNGAAKIAAKFRDGSGVPGAKKFIAKKSKQIDITPRELKLRDTERVVWMEANDILFWPEEMETAVHSVETQFRVETYAQLNDWQRQALSDSEGDCSAKWFLALPLHVKQAIETCFGADSLIKQYTNTGSRTTHCGIQFFKHMDGSIALLRGEGVQCKCGIWHPRRT
jgi:hypothetical protein